MMRLLCLVGLHVRQELVVEREGDIDHPWPVPWWVCPDCGNRKLF